MVADAGREPSYRFARSPGWIASHVFVACCVLLFIRLGFWQLSRLDERRASNAEIAARIDEPTVPLTDLVEPDTTGAAIAAIERRPVEVTGTYLADAQVLVSNRTYNEAPGYWVVTPLRSDGGSVVAVNRGWVPLTVGEEDPGSFAPPTGPVTVTGLLRATEEAGPLGGEGGAGVQARLPRLDTARLAEQWPGPVLGPWVQLTGQDPAPPGTFPEPVPVPELDEGSHLSYAIQWFTFATLTVIFYAMILRSRAREHPEAEALDLTDGAPDPSLVVGGPP